MIAVIVLVAGAVVLLGTRNDHHAFFPTTQGVYRGDRPCSACGSAGSDITTEDGMSKV